MSVDMEVTVFKGIIEHRVSPRAPFKTEMIIELSNGNTQSVTARTVDISAGGIQFFVPFDKKCLSEGELIKLLFNLPFYGKTNIDAIIKYSRPGIDLDQLRTVCYGAKFVNITMDAWNAIIDFSRATIETDPEKTTYYHDRNDIRITAKMASKVYLGNEQYCSCQIEDISFGGAKLRMNVPIPVNAPINLLILDPKQPFEIDGVSVWAEPSENDHEFFIGVFFNQLDSEKYNQLRAYIFKLVAERESRTTTFPDRSNA